MKINRSSVEAADAILGEEFSVYTHGHVRLIDYMGNDAAIVQAARVSYGEGTKSIREDDGLIDYLMRKRHTSPFEMVEFKFHIKAPIFVERQWFRHRTASINSVSGRYSEYKDEFFVPPTSNIQPQDKKNRQGRSETFDYETELKVQGIMSGSNRDAFSDYRALIDLGVAREIARLVLPTSLYTEWYWKIDLHNLFHFLSLRTDPHAQQEIRDYAQVIEDIVAIVVPVAHKKYKEHGYR